MRWCPALLSIALLGCEEVDDPCAVAAEFGPPAVELGIGQDAFELISDGDMVAFEAGSQGGRHLWVAARAAGIAPGTRRAAGADDPGPRVQFWLWGDGLLLGQSTSWDTPLEGDEQDAFLLGLPLVVGWFEPEAFGSYTLRVELTDACGTDAADEHTVVIAP